MTKLIGRRARLLLLTSLLVGAIFGSFHNSVSFAQEGPEQPALYDGGSGGGSGGGGAGWNCPDAQTCGNFGCHAFSYTDPTQVCSRWKLEGTGPGTCPSPVLCTQ